MPAKLNQKPKPPGPEIKAEFADRTATLTTRSANIKTLADALRLSQVDLTVWEVERHEANSWEVTMGANKTNTNRPETYTNFQVKVWFRRIMPTVMEVAIERLLKDVARGSRKAVPIVPDSTHGRYLLEVSLFDAHFGLLSWNRETGDDYDLKQAEHSYALAVEDLLGKTEGCRPEKILFPFGNDYFHVNNPEGVTPHGHNVLDVDGRLGKVFEVGARALRHAIDRCLQVAPVEIIWIPGNHDPETSYFLCQYIKAFYRQNPNVTVNVEPAHRKYVRYGTNLIGYTHGNEEKHADLPLIMANENRAIWSEVTCLEVHTGHFHKKKETRFTAGDTHGGVVVRTLPSISGTDAWHFGKGYVKGNRMAEAFLFDYYRGLIASYSSMNLRSPRPAARRKAA